MFFRKNIEKIFVPTFLFFYFIPGFLLADHSPEHVPEFSNPLSVDSFEGLITLILEQVVLPVGAVVAVIFLIFSGFLFVTARGNEEKLNTAKNSFLWTVVGVAILLGAVIISQGIQNTICQIGDIPGLCQ